MLEIQQAGTFWIKIAQASSFSREIRALNDDEEIDLLFKVLHGIFCHPLLITMESRR